MKKRMQIVLTIFIIIIILFFIIYSQIQKKQYIENVLIFNLYENSPNKDYFFDLDAEKASTYNINLYNTLDIDSLFNNKVAPGTKGEFQITLFSSKNIKYKIQFISINNKPKNMLFSINNNKKTYKSLEELGKNLYGTLTANNTKKIYIKWFWAYETSNEENIQDTIDGTNIDEYNFDINVLCYEI